MDLLEYQGKAVSAEVTPAAREFRFPVAAACVNEEMTKPVVAYIAGFGAPTDVVPLLLQRLERRRSQ